MAAIHDHTLAARTRQKDLLARTRRTSQLAGPVCLPIDTPREGFITWLHLDGLAHAIDQCVGDVEVAFETAIGTYVATGDPIGTARTATPGDAERLVKAARAAVQIDRQRDIARDPADGIAQLAAIGWTSVSSAKSNPAAGRLAIRALRDLAARWAAAGAPPRDAHVLPVVLPDPLWGHVLSTFELFAVAATESQQHQSLAEVLRTFALLLPRLPDGLRRQVAYVTLRLIPALCREVLTADLELGADYAGRGPAGLRADRCSRCAGPGASAAPIRRGHADGGGHEHVGAGRGTVRRLGEDVAIVEGEQGAEETDEAGGEQDEHVAPGHARRERLARGEEVVNGPLAMGAQRLDQRR